jgi:hypothetical protein
MASNMGDRVVQAGEQRLRRTLERELRVQRQRAGTQGGAGDVAPVGQKVGGERV